MFVKFLIEYEKINPSNEELLKSILYDNEQSSFDSNAKILTAMLENIQALKRFEYVGNENLHLNSPLSLNIFFFVYL